MNNRWDTNILQMEEEDFAEDIKPSRPLRQKGGGWLALVIFLMTLSFFVVFLVGLATIWKSLVQ